METLLVTEHQSVCLKWSTEKLSKLSNSWETITDENSSSIARAVALSYGTVL